MCAGYDEVMKDPSLEDNGGPLIKTEERHKILIGVVSFGEEGARPGYSGVYIRVGSYLDFIKNILDEHEECINNIYYNILQYHILHISVSDNRHKNIVNITDILYPQFSWE